MNESIKVEAVSKQFGKKVVLQNIDLHFEQGKIHGLIGPSGAGKTTLIKMIVGMDSVDTGQIHVLNQKMPSLKILEDIGYMAQADSLYLNLTGKENLNFFAMLYKLTKSERQKRIACTTELVSLTEDLNKKVSTYSGGMKRRLSLAIALIQDPKILILDEPTVGIDPELRLTIWNELTRLKNEEDKTIIVTTHVMDEAEKCDFIEMVRSGKILTSGTPTQLMDQYGVNNLNDAFLRAGRKINENSSVN